MNLTTREAEIWSTWIGGQAPEDYERLCSKQYAESWSNDDVLRRDVAAIVETKSRDRSNYGASPNEKRVARNTIADILMRVRELRTSGQLERRLPLDESVLKMQILSQPHMREMQAEVLRLHDEASGLRMVSSYRKDVTPDTIEEAWRKHDAALAKYEEERRRMFAAAGIADR